MNKDQGAPYPDIRYAAFVVAALFLAYVVAYLDRQIVSVLISSLRSDLKINDTQVSLIQGIAFASFFAFAGLPLGRLADRGNRRNLIVFGLVMWSLATIACGLATNFWQLFAARMMVGVGEAALGPASVSLLSDYFAPRHRGRAITAVHAGMPLGTTLSLMGGGLMLSHLNSGGDFGGLAPDGWAPWKVVFVTVGAPGLLVAALVACVREPVRRGLAIDPLSVEIRPGLLALLRAHPWTWTTLLIVGSCISIIGYGVSVWAPTILMRVHHLSPAQAGAMYGAILLSCSVTATIGGGFLSDALARWRPVDGRAMTPVLLMPFLIAALCGLMAAPDLKSTIAAMMISAVLYTAINVSVPPAVQAITPNRLRGQAIALVLLVANLAGLGVAPTLIALTTDYGYRDEMKLQQSVGLCTMLVSIFALVVAVMYPRFYGATHAAQHAPGRDIDGP